MKLNTICVLKIHIFIWNKLTKKDASCNTCRYDPEIFSWNTPYCFLFYFLSQDLILLEFLNFSKLFYEIICQNLKKSLRSLWFCLFIICFFIFGTVVAMFFFLSLKGYIIKTTCMCLLSPVSPITHHVYM